MTHCCHFTGLREARVKQLKWRNGWFSWIKFSFLMWLFLFLIYICYHIISTLVGHIDCKFLECLFILLKHACYILKALEESSKKAMSPSCLMCALPQICRTEPRRPWFCVCWCNALPCWDRKGIELILGTLLVSDSLLWALQGLKKR